MEQNRSLTDVVNIIANTIDNSITRITVSGVIDVINIVNPVAGVAASIADNLLSRYNDLKFSLLLKGLSTGLNMEMRLNELYDYVTSSPEKAITVANLFRKTVNAECPKVCIIYGIILANHVESNTNFTQDELIVCRALENATEFDLVNFKRIMKNHLKTTSIGNRIVFPKDFADLNKFITTCEWGVYNRIFVFRIHEWGEMEELKDDVLNIDTDYYVANPASVLAKYINDAHQTWDH